MPSNRTIFAERGESDNCPLGHGAPNYNPFYQGGTLSIFLAGKMFGQEVAGFLDAVDDALVKFGFDSNLSHQPMATITKSGLVWNRFDGSGPPV